MKSSLLLLFGSFFISTPGLAHTLGSVTKNVDTSINKFAVTCYNDGNGVTDKYAFQIKYTSGLPIGLQLTVTKVGAAEGVTVDATKSGVFSSWGFNKGGDGPYELTVTKIAGGGVGTGKVPFTIEHHCMAANGAHTGTSDYIDISPPNQDDSNPPTPPQPPEPMDQPAKGTPGFSGSLNDRIESRRYSVTCSARKINKVLVQPSQYRFWIRGATPTSPYNVQITVSKGGESVAVLDATNNDRWFSGSGVLEQGEGPYTLVISKFSESGETSGKQTFSVKHECLSDSGARAKTGTPKKLP